MSDDKDNPMKTVEKMISHPLEELFDIEEGSTAVSVPEPRDTQLVNQPTYDDKDSEIEENFQEVYDKAMDAFDDIQTGIEGVEGKYKARNSEVSMMMLNTALSAAKEKAKMKEHKDNLKLKSGNTDKLPQGSTVNNTLINVSTSDVIRQMANQRSPVNNQLEDDEPQGETIEQEVEKPKRKMQPKRPTEDSGS